MVELVRWLRSAEEAGRPRPTFVGIDMQNPLGAIESLTAYLARTAPDLGAEVGRLLAPQRRAWQEQPYPQRGEAEYRDWSRAADEVMSRLEGLQSSGSAPRASSEAEVALYDARLVWQSAELSRTGDPALRDRYMAENLSWHHVRQPAGSGTVVWAHNTHVRLDRGGMGGQLEKLHPGELTAVCLTTHRGEYTAWDGSRMGTYRLLPGPTASLERLLHRVGMPILALDLRGTEAALPLLSEPMYQRNVGLYPADFGFLRAAPRAGFDLVLFVDETTATRPIH